MAKSSIHISVISAGSEAHNKRDHAMDHVYPELIKNNESLILKSISEAKKEIEIKCKTLSGRKLQKNAEPIREGVVNIKPGTTMTDLQNLAARLKKEFKIECFQIHIHRDEGKSRNELNYHAHMVFDYQDKQKGTVLKLDKQALSRIQTVTAEVLGMERGVSSDLTHLNAIQYKNLQEEKKVAEIALKQAEAIKGLKHLETISATLGDKAGEYIKTNMIGLLDHAKTTENISSLLLKNMRLGEELRRSTAEAIKVPQLKKDLQEQKTQSYRFEQYTALLLLSKEKKVTYQFEEELRKNPKIVEIIKTAERDQQKQDQNRDQRNQMER